MLLFQNKVVFLSLKIIFGIVNNVDPDEISHLMKCGISSGYSLFA